MRPTGTFGAMTPTALRASALTRVLSMRGAADSAQVEPAGVTNVTMSYPKRSLSEVGASERKSRSERDSL